MNSARQQQHAKIKAAFALRDLTFVSIARELDVTQTAVHLVSAGKRRSERIEQAIADAMETSPSAIWPLWYPEDTQINTEGDYSPDL